MTPFVLDTDVLSLFQHGHPKVQATALLHEPDLAVTVISVEEQMSGWYKLLRKARQPSQLAFGYRRLTTNVQSLSRLRILTFDVPAILRYQQLDRAKLNIRKNDLRIAAIVLELNATLVTRNARDFQRVPGLTFVDWST